ncbi:hypothetical protein B0H17DRAFT_1190776 [Mycena rosella]|uniref:F-box domain-containing protein n=1 Tax=Mycena rosella TaxID=1033263 RepID=A0AAD7H150_MYCRO|nr:hypothetical protein B0H17DRAFT_1190776 [Mycena rosella]
MPPRKKTAAAGNAPAKRSRKISGTSASTVSPAATRRFRGRGGQLRMLPEMPLDILFEIFSHLEPPDVLHLARTTKDLRNVLMSHSAISIWKSAFLNDPDLPGVPEGLNEPQYANLAFSPHCHFCFVAGEHSILWVFRVRVCQKCIPSRYDEARKITKNMAGLKGNTDLLRRSTANTGFLHCLEEAEELNKELLKLKKGDASKLEDFIAERNKFVEEIHAKAEMSVPLRFARRQRILQEARDRKKEAIRRRLRELGYTEEVEYINDNRPDIFSEHALVKSNNELTDRIWENNKPQLIELMQDVREKMKRKQRKTLLKNRQRLLLSVLKAYNHERPIDEINPRAVEVCVLPNIKAMIEDPSMDAYTTEDSFQEVVDGLPRLFEEWRESKTRSLLALLPGRNDRDFLYRATTYFRCSECSEPIAYPRILAHACLYELRHGHRNRDDDLAQLCVNLDSEPWNCDGKRVSYYTAAEASATSVVRTCGLDTNMTTAQDMDDVNPWLECLRCSHKVRGKAIFRWRKAILHDMYHAASAEESVWGLLGDKDSEAAEELQQKAYQNCASDVLDYICTRPGCRQQFSFWYLRSHLRVSHGIEHPDEEEDYALQVDASMDQPPFPLMLPHSTPEVIEIADDDNYELEYIGNCIVVDDE